MYQDYFHLRTDPLRMSPDSLPCFVHESFQTAQSCMLYATGKKEAQLVIRLEKDLRDKFVAASQDVDTSASLEISGLMKRYLALHEREEIE